MSSYVRSAADFFAAPIERDRSSRDTKLSEHHLTDRSTLRFLTTEERNFHDERSEISLALPSGENRRRGTTRRRNNDERTEREREGTKIRRKEREDDAGGTCGEARRGKGNYVFRESTPRPRSYGFPHCRDAGAKGTFVTFPPPLSSPPWRRKNGEARPPEAKINGTDVNEIKTESGGCICTAWGRGGQMRQKDIRDRRAWR